MSKRDLHPAITRSMTWFRRFLDPPRTGAPADPQQTETAGALRARGGAIRPLKIGDLADAFQERLRAVCEADTNITAVWLGWVTDAGRDELLTIVRFDHADERT